GAGGASFHPPALARGGRATPRLYARATLAGDGILDLTPGVARAADEAEVARLPAAFKSAQGRLLALSDAQNPPRWTATWAEKTEVLAAQVDRLRVDVLFGESGRAAYELWAEVRIRGAQQLTFTLPPGFELAAGGRNGAEIATGVAGARETLAVPLSAGEGAQVVHLKGLAPLALPAGNGDLVVPLPALSAPAARVEMRLLRRGGRAYALAAATRAGSVAPPPSIAAPAAPATTPANMNNLGDQVRGAARKAAEAPPLPTPAGFAEVQAAWSALSAAPAPLVLHVK